MWKGGPSLPAPPPAVLDPDTRCAPAAHLPGKGGQRASRQEAALETLQQRRGPLVVFRRHRGGGVRLAWKRAEERPETEEAEQIGGKMWAGLVYVLA